MATPSRLRSLPAVALSVAALVSGLLTTSAGPTAASTVRYGTVVFVADGDTIDVDLAGDGTHRPRRIRYIGVQATELSRYSHTLSKIRGECWAVAATRYLHQLVDGRQVRITSRREASHRGSRLHRSIAFQQDGRWQDSGRLVLAAGLALPDLTKPEYAWNRDYLVVAEQAAAAHLGMYGDPARCGPGVQPGATLDVDVRWDAPGNDGAHPNGEAVRITNRGAGAVDLSYWWVRDAAYRGPHARGYTFAAGTVVGAGRTLVVHPGRGADRARVRYWGLSEPVFANVTASPSYLGDGAWLFDPRGNLRAWDMYPAR